MRNTRILYALHRIIRAGFLPRARAPCRIPDPGRVGWSRVCPGSVVCVDRLRRCLACTYFVPDPRPPAPAPIVSCAISICYTTLMNDHLHATMGYQDSVHTRKHCTCADINQMHQTTRASTMAKAVSVPNICPITRISLAPHAKH